MANHAYAACIHQLDPTEVDGHVRRLVKEKLADAFEVNFDEGEKSWYLAPKDVPEHIAGYLSFSFWLETKSTFPARPYVIEFRHGHTFDFMWWVEAVIRENLGQIYGAHMYDDGCEIDPEPNPERYETFDTFLGKDTFKRSFYTTMLPILRKEGGGILLDRLNVK